MWNINKKGEKEFIGGKEDYRNAAKEAENCPYFKMDDEDELVADEIYSCYNCQFRRWTPTTFICCLKAK